MLFYDKGLVFKVAHQTLDVLEKVWCEHRGPMPEDQQVGHVCAAMALACATLFTRVGYDRKLFLEQLGEAFDGYQKAKSEVSGN